MTDIYPGSPLAQTLGLTRGMRAYVAGMPDDVRAALDLDALGIDVDEAPSAGLEYVHLFVTDRDALERQLKAACELVTPSALIWVSTPVNGGLDQDEVATVAAPLRLDAADRAAVGDGWTGLRLAIRPTGG